MIDKIYTSVDEAVADIGDGASLHIGGFSEPASVPSHLLAAIARRAPRGLTVISIDVALGAEVLEMMIQSGRDGVSSTGVLPVPDGFHPLGLLVEAGLIAKAITSGASDLRGGRRSGAEQLLETGGIEIELQGQGTLAERIRAARVGIPGFYTPIGLDTFSTEGKEIRIIDGVRCAFETALMADFAIITADKADRYGNLVYRGTARTTNAVMAGAARTTIVEVNEIVELGSLHPDTIVTAGAFVDRVVLRPPGMGGSVPRGAE